MKTTTIFLICLHSSLLHAETGKYDASKIVEPTPEMLKMTSAELFKEIDISGLIENKGIIYFWTNKNLKSRELEINIRKEFGIKQQLLKPHEIHDLEPHIKKIYHGEI